MYVVFIHGWSVTDTEAYGGLPAAVQRRAPANLDVTVEHLHLSRYVSFHDEVTVDDLARGLQNAVNTQIVPKLGKGERFACITHSTGGPVARQWVELYYRDRLRECPLRHLVMLAPANHGSALAQLGKGRLARMKFMANGVEPGTGVLDWLELGSDQNWALNQAWLEHDWVGAGLFPFVLTGQAIDRQFYDSLNSYTGEAGSDGVVRVAAANLNYGLLRLEQREGILRMSKVGHSRRNAFGILPGCAHSGTDIGIMSSVRADDDGSHPTLEWILKCLTVGSANTYATLASALDELTATTQDEERKTRTQELFPLQRTFTTSRYCMLVFRIIDDRGAGLTDYDVLFTAGPDYDENHLAPGFFKDRQRNRKTPGKLTYYLDYDVMAQWLARPQLQGKFGLRIAARPDRGFAYYAVAEYRGTLAQLQRYFEANQTLMIEIQLQRHVVAGVFTLTQSLDPAGFKDPERGDDIP